jgi:Fungal specific transcription factor domain
MWLSILFSMMCLAEQFSLVVGSESSSTPQDPQCMMQKYRAKAVQCLVLGNYTKPTEYVLEALLHYHAIEQYRNIEDRFGNSLLVGIIVRTAMRMGYHRDPSHYPNISVLHGEMRRRIWSTVMIADILTASQVGLPKLINDSQTDTKPPHNLLDEDFDEQTVEPPSPRPDTEYTEISYAIIKYRLMNVFGKIADQTTSTQSVSYMDDVMRLDQLLHDTYNSTPPALRMRPTVSSVTDSSALILRRFALEILFQKSRCVLHRRYVVLARSERRYFYSRQSCVDAAMVLLHHQSVVHSECQPGGLLQRERWKLAPVMVQEFLLAAMIICMEVDHLRLRSPDASTPPEEAQSEGAMLQVLQKSYSIWRESATFSMEALKASTVLKIILDKVSPTAEKQHSTNLTTNSTQPDPWPIPGTDGTYLNMFLLSRSLHFRHRFLASTKYSWTANWRYF